MFAIVLCFCQQKDNPVGGVGHDRILALVMKENYSGIILDLYLEDQRNDSRDNISGNHRYRNQMNK